MTVRPEDIPAARALWQAMPGVGLSPADEPTALTTFLARNPAPASSLLRKPPHRHHPCRP